MIVGPRVEFDVDHYPRIRVWDSRAGHDRYLYLHRLTAFAHGRLDSLWSDLHVHHLDHDGWNNSPENLEATEPAEHGNYHMNGVADD
ncbi:MAG: HNH endonuclease [Natrialbaceae archaeon]|nr:HNH endonuclease [Natrialbaceae archaeon]